MIVTLNPIQATYVSYGAPNNNYNDRDYLRCGVQSDTGTRYMALVQFLLDIIPPFSIVNSAALELYSFDDDNVWQATTTQLAQRCTTAWVANEVTYNSRPAVTTEGQASMTAGGYNVWYPWDVKNIVQAWLNGANNHGLWIIQDGLTTQRGKVYKKSGEFAPKLTVDYTPVGMRVRDNGVWKRALVYVKDNNVWRLALAYAKDNGSWKLGI